LLEYTYI